MILRQSDSERHPNIARAHDSNISQDTHQQLFVLSA